MQKFVKQSKIDNDIMQKRPIITEGLAVKYSTHDSKNTQIHVYVAL